MIGMNVAILGARTAYEIGVDMIKTHYTGNVVSFSKLVGVVDIPIASLAIPKREAIVEILEDKRNAINARAAGIVFRRNIWQYENHEAMVLALTRTIHEDSSMIEETLAVLG